MNYREEVLKTVNVKLNQLELLINATLGLAGEAGEVSDVVKKYIFHKHVLNKDELIKELGDCLWYIEVISHILEISTEEVKKRNIEKLRKRYPNGFTEEASINRNE